MFRKISAVKDAQTALENARYNLVIVQKSDTVSKNVRDREYEHTLSRARSGAPGGGGPGAQGTTTPIEVTVTPETRFYKSVATGPAGNQRTQGGGQAQPQAEEGTLEDVKVGNTVMVWGPKSGDRITADVIYIQSLGR